MNTDAVQPSVRRQGRMRVIIALAAGDDVNVETIVAEIKSEIAHDLACRRVVRIEITIENDQAGARRSRHSGPPMTSMVPKSACRYRGQCGARRTRWPPRWPARTGVLP